MRRGISKKTIIETIVRKATAIEIYFMVFLENMPIILQQNEELIKVVRKHVMFVVPMFFTWPWLIAVLFLVKRLLNFDFFGYWSWVLIAAVLIVALVILYKLFIWKNDALVITNQRLIENEQHGFFSKTVTQLLYKDVLEVSYDKSGMSASMYDYGDLKIRTASENVIVLEKIADPDQVVELINRVRQGGSLPADMSGFAHA